MVKPTVGLVVLALSGQARGAAPVPTGADCAPEGRPIELKVGVAVEPVCLGAGGSVWLKFDSPILAERTEVEGGNVEFGLGKKHISLLAGPELAVGERRRVTVHFADGLEPASTAITLEVQPGPKLRQVRVFRQPRTAASLREEVEELTRRLEVCVEGGGQEHMVSASEAVLPRLLALPDSAGVTLPWSTPWNPPVDPNFEGEVFSLQTLLFPGEGGKSEAALQVKLMSLAPDAWRVEEAALLSSEGEPLGGVRTLAPVVVPARKKFLLYVVAAPTERAVAGTYTLKLRGGGRELVVENVTFK